LLIAGIRTRACLPLLPWQHGRIRRRVDRWGHASYVLDGSFDPNRAIYSSWPPDKGRRWLRSTLTFCVKWSRLSRPFFARN